MTWDMPAAWPGPMEGVMHPALVLAANQLGLTSVWLTPFLRISNAVPRDKHLKAFLAPFQSAAIPLVVQLMGTDAGKLAETAGRLAGVGIRHVNLNFGCPSRQVVGGGAGGGALRQPKRMLHILTTLKERCPQLSVSAKIRLGFADPAESRQFIPLLAGSQTLDYLIIHFRTVREQYAPIPDGPARLQRAVALAAPLPVIGNGDIIAPEEAGQLRQLTGCAAVMAARGFLRDPYLLRRIEGMGGLPTPAAGRLALFRAVLEQARRLPERAFSNGKAVELANFLWGKANPVLRQLRDAAPGQWRELEPDRLTIPAGFQKS